MPQLIVRETTVYGLEELKELFPHAYDKAIEKVIMWSWEGWEPSFFTDDLIMWIQEDYPAFSLNCRTIGPNGQKRLNYDLEWDMDNSWIRGRGYTSVRDFLINHRLRNKYQLLWNMLKKFGITFDIECSFGYGYDKGYAVVSEFIYEIEYYQDELGKERCERIVTQVEALEKEIEVWMCQIHDKLRGLMRAEQDYRFSTEFAIDEADAHELTFTEEGEIFRG